MAQTLEDLFDDIEKNLLEALDDSEEKAVEICRRERPVLKAAFKEHIEQPSKNRPYVNFFYTKKLSDEYGTYGCRLSNRKYPLSHLLEDGHVIKNQYGGPYENRRGLNRSASYANASGWSTKGRSGKSTMTIGWTLWKPEAVKMTTEFYKDVRFCDQEKLKER